MRHFGVFKWRIPLREFGVSSLADLETLEKCGLELSKPFNVVVVRIILATSQHDGDIGQDERDILSETIDELSSYFLPTSVLKKIFNTISRHIRENDPDDIIMMGDKIEANPDFVKEAEKEFMTRVNNYVRGLIHDQGYIYEADPSVAINYGNYKFNPITTGNFMKFTMPKPSVEDKSHKLKNIRSVEKIVRYDETDWKVNYTVGMEADETYAHKIEICDYNDFENKTEIVIRTDSHFIKALDQQIKDAIIELKKNLWTIDRFEKWSGDLSG